MSSFLSKKTIKVRSETAWFIDMEQVEKVGYQESAPFGTETTRFTWRALKKKQQDACSNYSLYLHLLACAEAQIEVEATVWYGIDFPADREDTFDGEISLGQSKTIGSETFENYSLYLSSELTFEEIDPSVNQLKHYQALSRQLLSVRVDAGNSADITLVTTVDGQEFAAHALILSLRSPVFAAMFSHSQVKEAQSRRVEIEDISGQVLEALLKYVYECEVEGIEPIAGDLLVAANKYDLPLLVAECAQSMINHLVVSKAAYYFYLANLLQLDDLKAKIGDFILANKGAVRQSAGFKEFIKPNGDLLDALFDLLM